MGYYITFVFDPMMEELNREKLIMKFLKAGVHSENDEHYEDGKVYLYKGQPLSFLGYKPEALQKGFYADVRFSWASKSDEIVAELKDLLDLADRLDCRLYDGQVDMWITRENIKLLANEFPRQANAVMKLIASCKRP